MKHGKNTVADMGACKPGIHAVFRHTSKGSKAHFCVLHESLDSAEAEAIRLLASKAAEDPGKDHTMYVIKIVKAYKLVDGKFVEDLGNTPV